MSKNKNKVQVTKTEKDGITTISFSPVSEMDRLKLEALKLNIKKLGFNIDVKDNNFSYKTRDK